LSASALSHQAADQDADRAAIGRYGGDVVLGAARVRFARLVVGRPSPQNPSINRLTSPPDSLTSKCRGSRHTISNTIRDGTQSVCENTQSVQLGDHRE
jgi:hypothetical protein